MIFMAIIAAVFLMGCGPAREFTPIFSVETQYGRFMYQLPETPAWKDK
jgi:hypothetical protein